MPPHVLIVHRDLITREALASVLSYEGYSTASAPSHAAAEALLREGGRPSVILAEVMPDEPDGWRLVSTCGADPALSTIPFIVMATTRHPLQNQPRVTAPIRAFDYPFDLDQLLDLVRALGGPPTSDRPNRG